LVYAAFVGKDTGESMAYATAPSVTGPWTYRGQIQNGSNCYTIHGGIIDYKDHSYYFYHMNGIPGGGVFNRSAACEEFTFNSDGSIPSLPSTKEGPEQIELLDPFVRTEAETICWSEGIKTEKCSEGGVNIANIENGDYIKVSGVDFSLGADTFTASVASAGSGGKIELHIDSLNGDIIGTCDVPVTDGWQSWTEVSCPVEVSGEHDLYLKFTGGSGYLFNVDWWKFSGPGSAGSAADDGFLFHSTYETGTNSWSGRGSAKVAASTDASYAGSKSLRVTGREASWNGAVRTLGSKFKAGQSYSFSADVMYDSGETSQKFYLTLQYKDSEGEVCYDKVATGTAVSGEWLQLADTSYTLPEGASDFYLYVETAEGECDFYIDEAIGAEDGTVIEGPGGGIVFTLGDIDDNGVINALDIALARQVLAGSLTDTAAKLAADVSNDGEVKANDVVLIQRFVLGEITSFNVVEVMT
ncbi:MAG: carbohydrate-binding protein, partial [Ruminococcus sp.]|nr:carbohydrate-binding protein [Ruminococcus sp.]